MARIEKSSNYLFFLLKSHDGDALNVECAIVFISRRYKVCHQETEGYKISKTCRLTISEVPEKETQDCKTSKNAHYKLKINSQEQRAYSCKCGSTVVFLTPLCGTILSF